MPLSLQEKRKLIYLLECCQEKCINHPVTDITRGAIKQRGKLLPSIVVWRGNKRVSEWALQKTQKGYALFGYEIGNIIQTLMLFSLIRGKINQDIRIQLILGIQSKKSSLQKHFSATATFSEINCFRLIADFVA